MLSTYNNIHSESFTNEDIFLIQSIYKALQDHILENYNVYAIAIIHNEDYFEMCFVSHLMNTNNYSTEDVYNIVKKVISNDDIVFICHSDESGPFPEDLGLEEIIYYKTVLELSDQEKDKILPEISKESE